tara:strand:+ start:2761 stop:3012 length:252 start_codon:yes stop_codon:yes gene_type:complete
MPTIIQHTPTGGHYILIGTGYGQWASSRPNRLLGDISPTDQRGEQHLLCVCDEEGHIFWTSSDDAKVVAVGNQSPTHALKAFQ